MLSKGHKRKQQIVDTAKDMFIEHGFQSTHIGKVCEELNIARGTVYQYFGNKREILYAILETAEERIDDILDQDDLKDFMKNNPSQKAILSFTCERVTETILAILDESIIIKLIFRDIIGIDEGVVSRINKFIEHVSKAVLLDIDEMGKKGIIRKGIDPEITSLMLIGGVLFIVKDYENRQKEKITREEIDAIVGNYIKGILK